MFFNSGPSLNPVIAILKGKNKSLPFLSEDSFIKEIQSPQVLSPQGSGGKRLSAKLIKSWSKFSTFIDPFMISYHSLYSFIFFIFDFITSQIASSNIISLDSNLS